MGYDGRDRAAARCRTGHRRYFTCTDGAILQRTASTSSIHRPPPAAHHTHTHTHGHKDQGYESSPSSVPASGPSGRHSRAQGSKRAARRPKKQLGLPGLPGFPGSACFWAGFAWTAAPPNPCLNQTFHSLLPLLCHRMLLVRILLRKYLTDYQRASGNNQDHGSTPFATSSHLVRLFRFSCSTRPAPGWHQPGATECVSEAHQHSFLTVLVGPGPGPGGRPQFEHSVRFPSWCFNRHPRVSLGCAAWLGCGWLGRPVLAARRRLLVSASRVEQCTTPTRPRPTSQQGEKGQSRVDSRQSNNP